MKVEIDLTKSDLDKSRRLIGLKTHTRAEVFYQTDTGVDLFHIQNNNIKYVKTHKESS